MTPWSINLLILPAPGAALPPVRSGETRRWTFPSGDYPFHGHEEPTLGAYQQCSLFSPVFTSGAGSTVVTRRCFRVIKSALATHQTALACPLKTIWDG